MLRAAIVGCGKIADSHAQQLLRIPGAKIAAVCDREPLMAKQFADRFPVEGQYTDVAKMIEGSRPDVVHITTPPQSHFDIAKLSLEKGCHVYVEKPFTLYASEAETLIDLAAQKGLQITAGHDDQFRHAARRMRAIVATGYLGKGPVHMEAYYGYEMSNTGYAGALLGDKNHWVRKLPGQLLHNIISHGIARFAEYITDPNPQVIVCGFTSPKLESWGEHEIVDELRVILRDKAGNTGYFTFSSQVRPSLHQFRILGAKNGVVMDQDQETVIKLSGNKRKSYLETFVTPLDFAKQYVANTKHNIGRFLDNDFHMKSGMKFLIESFYKSIAEKSAPPIPPREILLTARIMDDIFTQLARRERSSESQQPVLAGSRS